jgi:hypothetical protein
MTSSRSKTKKTTVPKAASAQETSAKQFERFVKTARELGVDESGKAFDRAFKKIVRPKQSSD